MTRDRAARGRVAGAIRGRRPRRRDREADDGTYQPGKRAMIKIKHARTADCVVAGFRWHKNGKDELVGSLLLGLYDDRGTSAPRRRDVGVHDGACARELAAELEPLRANALDGHPWREWAEAGEWRRACRAARAAGARARICRGSRCASSACAR